MGIGLVGAGAGDALLQMLEQAEVQKLRREQMEIQRQEMQQRAEMQKAAMARQAQQDARQSQMDARGAAIENLGLLNGQPASALPGKWDEQLNPEAVTQGLPAPPNGGMVGLDPSQLSRKPGVLPVRRQVNPVQIPGMAGQPGLSVTPQSAEDVLKAKDAAARLEDERKTTVTNPGDIVLRGGRPMFQNPARPAPDTRSDYERFEETVLADEAGKLGIPVSRLTPAQRRDISIKARKDFGQADDRTPQAPRNRFSVQPFTRPDGTQGIARLNMDTGDVEPVDPAKLGGASFGKPTGEQTKAAGFYDKVQAANENALAFEDDLVGLGAQFASKLPSLITTETGRRYQQAKREFTEARLRQVSGAAVQPFEYENDDKMYFVQPNDDPRTIQQKQLARERVIRGLKRSSGNLQTPDAPPPAAGAAGAPKVEQWERVNGRLVKKGGG